MLIAISVTFPLFLIARERKLAATDEPGLKSLDVILLVVFAAMAASRSGVHRVELTARLSPQ